MTLQDRVDQLERTLMELSKDKQPSYLWVTTVNGEVLVLSPSSFSLEITKETNTLRMLDGKTYGISKASLSKLIKGMKVISNTYRGEAE